MAWKFHGSDDFDLNAGRNAFRSDASLDDWENADTETIMRRNSAIRSFTESVDSDFPPAPELPPSLNIDLHYSEEAMKRSETSETIIEKKPKPKPKLSLQEVVSGTHKYPMMVPGPGHIDEEQELHASLLHHDESDSDVEISSFERKQSSNTITKKEQQKGSDRDHAALRYGYSVSTLERPRPVTPTSWCAIENYIGGSLEAEDEPPPIAAKKQKIHVSIPNHNVSQTSRRRRRASMSWSDFYETMSTQLPSQARRSLSGSTTPLHDYDGDILEEDPRYRDVAPPKPVIHRRTSTDWESFMDKESEILKSTENNDVNKTDITTNDGDTKLISSKMPLYDIQTISDDQKRFAVSTASNPSENAENSKQIFASHTDNISSSGLETALQIQISDRLENSEWNEKTMMEQKKSTTNVESKKSSTIDKKGSVDSLNHIYDMERYSTNSEIESTIHYDINSYYEKGKRQTASTTDMADLQQTNIFLSHDGIFYQQSAENQQYACSYNEPQTQGYGGIQNLNYDYDTTQYQNYEQQQQQKQGGSSVYQNYDQMSYVTAFQTYDQQSAVSNDYGQQPVIMRDYDQSITLSGYGISEYDQSEEYSYDQAIGYNAYSSSIVPSANNQNYMSQTVSESYSDINKKSSNDFGAQQYEQRNAENLPMDINDDGYRPPIIPKYIAPLFPTVISSEPNPFSWEAQENAAATTFAESIPEYVVQSVQPSSTKTYLETTNEIDSAEEIKQKPPLQRPASPSPSVERVIPPIRPPPPPPPLPLSPNRKQSLHQRLCPSKLMKSESEEDAWTQFKKITERATISVKSTEEKLKELEKTTAAKDLKDESYLAQIGGSQACISEQAYRHAREKGSIAISVKNKKKMKNGKIKKIPEPELTLEQEDDMDRAAIELAKKMAATRIDMQDWKMPLEQHDDESVPYEKPNKLSDEISMIVPNESRKDDMIDKETSNILKESNITTTFNRESNKRAWTGFDDSQSTELPPSESGFFTNISAATVSLDKAFGDPMFASDGADASIKENLIDEDYDPFNVCPADDLVKEAKARVAAAIAAEEIQDDVNFFTAKVDEQKSDISSSTQEGDSLTNSRPTGFDDEFQVEDDAASTPSPLYDEDDSEPLTDFPVKFTGDGWEMMIRYPIKKKIINDRYWKPCYVRLRDNTLLLFNSKAEQKPFMEILLQATYSLSDPTLQAYDVYGKIHTVKLQYVLYKERVGIRPGQISRLVEGHVTKYGLPLEHSAQCTVLLKFGSLNAAELFIFVATVEDILFRCIAVRNNTPLYKQDEVQIHCYDEYSAYVDKFNILSDQKARVRLFCLAFVSGSPILEIGLNDRRRQGKEIVRRKDILPMYTERWIRFENLEFHNTVDRETFEKEQVIRLSPPDGCFFEMMRFRVRPPKNREKPLTVRCVMKIAGSKVEIRIEAMAAAQTEKTKGGLSNKRQVPCEDIQIRFPIPEAWIYLFREERRWGVGSVHAKVRRPGKVKNLKDRLMGTVHNLDNSLIEAAIGEAKYEHVFRALVWRIPRLPEKYHAAYKEHLLRCHFELSSFDLMPETFTPTCDVEFTMPLAMISNTVVRSVSVEQHEDSDRVEKFVRYVAKCTYKVEIDYVQCSDLDIDAIYDLTITNPAVNLENIPEPHKAMFNPDEVKELHGGYRIDFSDAEIGAKRISSDADSSNDEEEDRRRAIPIVQIDPKRYNY